MSSTVIDVEPADLHERIARDEPIAVVDIREPHERARERLPNTMHHPFTTFNPEQLLAENPEGRMVLM